MSDNEPRRLQRSSRRLLKAKGYKSSDGKLGTFVGVFTPTLLTILGVIMYLRIGWVLGHMGLLATISIVAISNIVTLVTTLSFSSVATNRRIGIGGAYNIISRNLGLEIGGAVGLPLFLSQAFSVTLYAFGLAESIRIIWPAIPIAPAAFIIVLAIGALAFKGSDFALKVQLPLLGLVGVSLVLLGIGATTNPVAHTTPIEVGSGQVGYWVAFAVFFPAVTGVMAGLGLSGDLSDPRVSIPRGSISAVLLGFLVYLGIPVLLYLGAEPDVLQNDPMVWARIAPLGAWLIMPGLWGAIFSSAVGSVLGAPRTLQALALDGLAPKFLAKTVGSREEPRLGLIVTLVIALAACLLGDRNAVAPIVTMFFLTVYGTINLVAAFATLSGEVSWRPTLRIPWLASFAAGVACVAVMFLINPTAALVAVLLELFVWVILTRREQSTAWGDARRGLYEALMRWALVKIADRPMTSRNWRPHMLIFVERMERELELIHYGHWFVQGRGVVTVCELIEDKLEGEVIDARARRHQMEDCLEREGLGVFAEANLVRNIEDGLIAVAQANGMGGLTSNTLLLNLPSEPKALAQTLHSLGVLSQLGKSCLIGRIDAGRILVQKKRREIHVWWGSLQRNGDLMLLLAYLLTRNPQWRGAEIVISSLASNEMMRQNTQDHLDRLLPELRIEARKEVIIKSEALTVREHILSQSQKADVVFLGLAVPAPGTEEKAAERMTAFAEGLSTVFFVNNASPFGINTLDPSESPRK